MKILIGLDGHDKTGELSAYRVVDWPAAPHVGEDIYPFINASGEEVEVSYVGHFFERGYIAINAEPFEQEYLRRLLESEKDSWIISTNENHVTEQEAASILLAMMA